MTNQACTRGTLTSRAPENEPESGRDDQGRFSKGNRGGPGNPYARQTARLLKVIRDAVSAEELRNITRKLVEKAQQGDTAAARILFTYVVGKPLPAGQPDMVDHDEWELHRKNARTPDEMTIVLASVPTELSNQLVAAALPHITDTRQKQLAEGLAEPPAKADKAAKSGRPAVDPVALPSWDSANPQPGTVPPELNGAAGIAHFDRVQAGLEEDIRQARMEYAAHREARSKDRKPRRASSSR